MSEVDPLYLDYLEARVAHDTLTDALTALQNRTRTASDDRTAAFEAWQAAGGRKIREQE